MDRIGGVYLGAGSARWPPRAHRLRGDVEPLRSIAAGNDIDFATGKCPSIGR